MIAMVSEAAGDSRPGTSGLSKRRTAVAVSGRVTSCTRSSWRCSISPRPSSDVPRASRTAARVLRSTSRASARRLTSIAAPRLKSPASACLRRSSRPERACSSGTLNPSQELDLAEGRPLPETGLAETDQLEQGEEDHDRVQPRLSSLEEDREADGAVANEASADAVHLVCQRVAGQLHLHVDGSREPGEDGLEGSRQPVAADLQALTGNDLALDC